MSVDPLWSRSLHKRSGVLAASAGVVVTAERHSRLVCLDARNGEMRWEHRVEGSWGTAVIAGERCFHLSQGGTLDCLHLETGGRLWSVSGLGFSRYVTVCGDSVVVGGWRGYEPLTRLSLADGSRLPLAATVTGALAWPLALDPVTAFPATAFPATAFPATAFPATAFPATAAPFERSADVAIVTAGRGADVSAGPGERAADFLGRPTERGAALLVAPVERAVLLLIGVSGLLLGEVALPGPVRGPDGGRAFGDDGNIVFVAGDRTVMGLDAERGVDVLWRHPRNLAPLPPVIDGSTMWLVDEDGIAVADPVRGSAVHRPGLTVAGAGIRVAGRALFALRDGTVVAVDGSGQVTGLLRVPAGVDRLVAGRGDGVFHVLGKGWLRTWAPAGS
ncbi:PQQ-binding-like beta-propeller repeat protein [Actinoplanes sp. CA-054009]